MGLIKPVFKICPNKKIKKNCKALRDLVSFVTNFAFVYVTIEGLKMIYKM